MKPQVSGITRVALFCLAALASEASSSAGVLERIAAEAEDFPGRLGVCARHLDTGEEIRFRAQEKFPTASAIKTAVMVEFFRQQAEGRISLDDPCVVLDSEKVGGSGTLQDATGPVESTYREMIELMITISDTTAPNVVVAGIGGLWDGIHAMNNRLETLGLKHTRLLNKMMGFKTKTKSPDSLRYGVGVTTPEDQVMLYERIYRGQIVDRATCDAMLDILKKQKYHSMIPGQLPMKEIPEIWVAHKTGSVGDAVIDAGIVHTPKGDYAIALFADGTDDVQWQEMLAGKREKGIPGTREDWPGGSAAMKKLATISRIIFDHFCVTQDQKRKERHIDRGEHQDQDS